MVRNTVFGQLLQLISRHGFKNCVDRYAGDKYTKRFSCWQQLVVLLYSQARSLKSLRDITISLRSQNRKWYHLGLESVARSTLSDANNNRRADIFEDVFYEFLHKCQSLAPGHGFKFKNPLYTMDSTLIKLCLSLFPWAEYRTRKGALKLHTLLDHSGCLPSFITITHGRCHELKVVQNGSYGFPRLLPDSILTVDRAYIDFIWFNTLTLQRVHFVTRAKQNLKYEVVGQHTQPKNKAVVSDQIIRLTDKETKKDYPQNLRLVTYYDQEKKREFTFITNNFKLAAATIAELYKRRWQIENFFKWIKQNLKIKTFLGTSENAVMTQVWTAMIYYLLLAFIKFQTKYAYTMHEFARIIGEVLLEHVDIIEVLKLRFDNLKLLKPDPYQMALALKI